MNGSVQNKKLRTAVIGAGKMGTIHAKVYDQLPESDLVAVVDIDAAKAQRLADQYNCSATTDCAEIVDKVDAVTIATPTVTHLKLAKIFIKKKIAVLIEKPLAANVREGRKIVALAKKYGTVVAVGHSERCNPVAQAMKRLDIQPKFIEANRISPYPFRSTDVGVVLDVMIHDIDIILSLAASKIKKVDAVGVNVVEDKEDICNARIVFDNGCISNITASRLALKTERRVRVFSRQAYLSVDYLKKSGIGDTVFFGPELEFFLFNDVRFDSNQNESYYFIDSREGDWNTGKAENPNLGYKIRYKEGYFPVPPSDTLQDIRSEIMLTLINTGVNIEVHHHEVATAGQCEIDMKYDTLVKMGDSMLMNLDVHQHAVAHLHEGVVLHADV